MEEVDHQEVVHRAEQTEKVYQIIQVEEAVTQDQDHIQVVEVLEV